MNELEIELSAPPRNFTAGEPITLQGVYVNRGSRPLALTFWWNRSMRVRDAAGRTVAPGPGPVLPCGVAEEWERIEAGARHSRAEPLQCTQPAGRSEPIGWSYALPAGTWRVTLIYEAPPAHGFQQARPDPHAFRGRVESNEVAIVVEPPPPRGLLGRLLG